MQSRLGMMSDALIVAFATEMMGVIRGGVGGSMMQVREINDGRCRRRKNPGKKRVTG